MASGKHALATTVKRRGRVSRAVRSVRLAAFGVFFFFFSFSFYYFFDVLPSCRPIADRSRAVERPSNTVKRSRTNPRYRRIHDYDKNIRPRTIIVFRDAYPLLRRRAATGRVVRSAPRDAKSIRLNFLVERNFEKQKMSLNVVHAPVGLPKSRDPENMTNSFW